MTAESHLITTRKMLIDRRTSLRFPCNLHAICRTGGGKTGVDWPARVRNLSAKGAGLLVARAFAPGTCLTVRFLRSGREPMVARMQVIHSFCEGDSWYHGCVFERRLSQQEVDGLLN